MHRSGAALRALNRAPSSTTPPEGLPAVQRTLEAAIRAVDSRHAAVRAAVAVALRSSLGSALGGGGGPPPFALSRSRSWDSGVAAEGPARLDPGKEWRGGADSDSGGDSEGLDEEWHLPAASRGPAGRQLRRGTSAEGRGGAWAAGAGGRRGRRASQGGLWAAADRRGRAGRPDSPVQAR